MEEKSIRQMKMCSRHRGVNKRWLGQEKEVPWLNMSGLWLENAGFKIGGRLQISVENNKLIIINQHGHQSH